MCGPLGVKGDPIELLTEARLGSCWLVFARTCPRKGLDRPLAIGDVVGWVLLRLGVVEAEERGGLVVVGVVLKGLEDLLRRAPFAESGGSRVVCSSQRTR